MKKNSIFLLAAMAIAMMIHADTAVARQASVEDLPPIYGILNNNQGGIPLDLSALETRVVAESLGWAHAINNFSANQFMPDVDLPFHIEGALIRNAQDLERRLRQWFVINELDNYRNEPWPITAVNLIAVERWVEDHQDRELFDYEQQQLTVIEDLGLNPDGYMVLFTFVNPADEFDEKSQGFYVDLNGTRPVFRGLVE